MKETPVKVFISYSHDSEGHKDKVLALSEKLRAKGIETSLDRYVGAPVEGWPRWMEAQIEQADFVLLVCTEQYLQRVKNLEPPGIGQGGTWEAHLIYNRLYVDKAETNKFLAVLLPHGKPEHIPLPLLGHTYFVVDEEGWSEDLYRFLTGQLTVVPREIGNVEKMPPSSGIGQAVGEELETSADTWQDGVLSRAKSTGTVIRNPFGDRGRISRPDRFFGREDVLQRLFEQLGRGNSCSLVGESQVGKSSILEMVCQLGPERLGLPDSAFVYIDMQVLLNEDEFFEELCEELKFEQTVRGRKLARALRGKRYIVCLDEIEKMVNRENFTGEERTELRGLAGSSDSPLTLAIASRSPLNVLFEDRPEDTSPLAGICTTVEVKRFSLPECEAFLRSRLQGTGVSFTQEQICELFAHTGGHPGRLQWEAHELFDRLTR